MNRIQKMEEISQDISSFLHQMETLLQQYPKIQSDYSELVEYYQSQDRRHDRTLSDRDDFPSPEIFPHGVLSEDGIYNLMIQHRTLALELLRMGVSMVEQ